MKKEEIKNKGYTKPRDLYNENGIEYGRHFGKWKCSSCENTWTSAYTWISTDFCIKNKDNYDQGWYNTETLKSKDFILEQCKDCTDSKVNITNYRKLKPNKNNNHIAHHAHLCAKCKKGSPCQEAY